MPSLREQRPMNRGMNNGLSRSTQDRMIAGVCGGIADFLGWNSTAVRVLYLLFIIFSFGTAIIAYFILALVMPR
ncbi:MAG: PspC domain-containing protein [Balneolaceae bacterium]|nr:PspC domain-containing protein [Balneolaceae bacterium]